NRRRWRNIDRHKARGRPEFLSFPKTAHYRYAASHAHKNSQPSTRDRARQCVPGQWSISNTRRERITIGGSVRLTGQEIAEKSNRSKPSLSRRRRITGSGSVGFTKEEVAEKRNRSDRSFSGQRRCRRNIGIAGQKIAEESSGIACTFCGGRYFSGCDDSSG